MNRQLSTIFVTAITVGMLAWAPTSAARIKCWTNNDGVRECGNTLPPEHSQKDHEELSEQGVVVGKTVRAKTPEELEADRRAAEVLAEQALEKKKQAQRDRVLLDTYSNIDDMEMARDGKIVALELRIKLTETHLAKLRENLDQQIAQAATMERGGKQPSEDMVGNIESSRKQIQNNTDFISDRQAEIVQMKVDYDADIKRFLELRNARF